MSNKRKNPVSKYRETQELTVRDGASQSVQNDLKRTRLSRRRMIWLLPFSPPLPSASCLSWLSLPVYRLPKLLTGGGGGGGKLKNVPAR